MFLLLPTELRRCIFYSIKVTTDVICSHICYFVNSFVSSDLVIAQLEQTNRKVCRVRRTYSSGDDSKYDAIFVTFLNFSSTILLKKYSSGNKNDYSKQCLLICHDIRFKMSNTCSDWHNGKILIPRIQQSVVIKCINNNNDKIMQNYFIKIGKFTI